MSEKHDDGGPVYPTTRQAAQHGVDETVDGMTLLDWFSGQIACGHEVVEDNRTWDKARYPDLKEWQRSVMRDDARYCYDMAEAMIAEKRRREGGGK